MSRINTNVESLIGQRVLAQNNRQLNLSLERLSTGLQINRGKDDPAGLIASENLRAEKTALGAAIDNAERADQVINIAEGGLDEIAGLLNELQGLVTTTANTAGLSQEEREANQLQIDSILQTIDRLASATSFQGSKLLNGNFDYKATNVSGQISSFKINGSKLGFNETRTVDVLVTTSAQVGGFFLSFGGNNLNLGGAGDSDGASEQFVIEIAGADGARELSFASGTALNDIAAAINSFTAVTGVKATVSGTTGIRVESDEFGSDQFVSLKVNDDGGIGTASNIGLYDFLADNADSVDPGAVAPDATFDGSTLGNGYVDAGQDVEATINGIVATTKGTTARINTDFLDVEVDLEYDRLAGVGNAARLGALEAFTIEGGGADFQLAPKVDISGKVGIGITNVAVRELGRSSVSVSDGGGGTNNQIYLLNDLVAGKDLSVVDGNLDAAQIVVEQSIREVASLRGRLGAFQQNTVGSTIRSLGVALENTTAAESVIRDTDFAEQTAELTRSQILVSSATNILSIANQSPQNALQLLG